MFKYLPWICGTSFVVLVVSLGLTVKLFQTSPLFSYGVNFNTSVLTSNLIPISAQGLFAFEVQSTNPTTFNLYQNLLTLVTPINYSGYYNTSTQTFHSFYSYNLTLDYYGCNGTGTIVNPINFTSWSMSDKYRWSKLGTEIPANTIINNQDITWYYNIHWKQMSGFYVLGTTNFTHPHALRQIAGSETMSNKALPKMLGITAVIAIILSISYLTFTSSSFMLICRACKKRDNSAVEQV